MGAIRHMIKILHITLSFFNKQVFENLDVGIRDKRLRPNFSQQKAKITNMQSTIKFKSCDDAPSASDDQSGSSEAENISESSLSCKAAPRSVLTVQQAREIFRMKNSHGHASIHAASNSLARIYRVSAKAIRDIWKGRSWLEATYDLWNEEDRPARRMLGRPKGRKDSKPRKARSSTPNKSFSSNEIRGDNASDAFFDFEGTGHDVIHTYSLLSLMNKFAVQMSQQHVLEFNLSCLRDLDSSMSKSQVLPPIQCSMSEWNPAQQPCRMELPGVDWLLRNGSSTQGNCLLPSIQMPLML